MCKALFLHIKKNTDIISLNKNKNNYEHMNYIHM